MIKMSERILNALKDEGFFTKDDKYILDIIEKVSSFEALIYALKKAKTQIRVFAKGEAENSIADAYCQEIDWAIEEACGK